MKALPLAAVFAAALLLSARGGRSPDSAAAGTGSSGAESSDPSGAGEATGGAAGHAEATVSFDDSVYEFSADPARQPGGDEMYFESTCSVDGGAGLTLTLPLVAIDGQPIDTLADGSLRISVPGSGDAETSWIDLTFPDAEAAETYDTFHSYRAGSSDHVRATPFTLSVEGSTVSGTQNLADSWNTRPDITAQIDAHCG